MLLGEKVEQQAAANAEHQPGDGFADRIVARILNHG
jgi:hypothetical protein